MKTSKTLRNASRSFGFTKLELAAVIGGVALIVAILMVRTGMRARSSQIACINNLKNIGLACRIVANDFDGSFPWHMSSTNWGTRELLISPWSVAPHFQTLSNELSSPKYLVCPTDKARSIAPQIVGLSSFATIGLSNISYFLGIDANQQQRASLLSGDRNLTLNGIEQMPGLVTLQKDVRFDFSAQLHKGRGSILLANGAVIRVPTKSWGLDEFVKDDLEENSPNRSRLLVP